MTIDEHRQVHWDAMFGRRGPQAVSWYETSPRMSLEMIDAAGVGKDDAVVDVGGGASGLAGALLARGFNDLTVVDVSDVALRAAREALGADAQHVEWIHADVLEWVPRPFGLWHDRAVFHFLTDSASRSRYIASAKSGVRQGGHLVLGTFAEDGPTSCSGLPVARYSADILEALFSPGFSMVDGRRDEHRTPGGSVQIFTWAAFRRDQ